MSAISFTPHFFVAASLSGFHCSSKNIFLVGPILAPHVSVIFVVAHCHCPPAAAAVCLWYHKDVWLLADVMGIAQSITLS